jgi:hypothetical protein
MEESKQMTYEEYRQYLEEKLLIIGNDKKYDQAIIMAGGAGSGKGFAISNFISGDKYKVFDPDELKNKLISIAKNDELSKKFTRWGDSMKDIKKMDLGNPHDVTNLHNLVKNLPGDPDNRLVSNMFKDTNRTYLPNILFDMTLKSPTAAFRETGNLLKMGYKPENIHIVWVLTDYRSALSNNYNRERKVFNDILLQTHYGAKTTMSDLVIKNYGSLGINGDLAVILGNKGMSTIKYSGRGGKVVEDFKYFRLKKAGQNQLDQSAIKRVFDYVEQFAPKSDKVDTALAQMYPHTNR